MAADFIELVEAFSKDGETNKKIKEEFIMRINHNLMAMNTHRQLSINSDNGSKSIEKLSSGMRINRAGDDAAGLAISEKMRGQIRGLNMASKNSQDGISLIQTAEGALNETHDILQRMRELGVQAANDTNNQTDRGQIQKEINQLTSEINRIGNTTEFNTKKLLKGELSDVSVVGSIQTAEAKTYTLENAPKATWTGGYKFAITSDGTQSGVKFTGTDDASKLNWSALDKAQTNKLTIAKTASGMQVDGTFQQDTTANKLVINAESMVLNSAGDAYVYNNHGISFQISKAEFDKTSIGDKVDINLVANEGAAFDATAANIKVKNDWTKNDNDPTKAATMTSFEITNSQEKVANLAKVKITASSDVGAANSSLKIELMDATNHVLRSDTVTTAAVMKGTTVSYNNNGVKFNLAFAAAATGTNYEITVGLDQTTINKTEDKSLTFQVGANEHQSMSLGISDMRSKALGISGTAAGSGFAVAQAVTDGTNNTAIEYALDVSSAKAAAASVTVIQSAIEKVSDERSKLGAVQNRLEHTIKNLDTSSENLQGAESRIRDVDMAKEMMNFSKNNILQQAAQAMLAQANQAPQGVLQLLR